MENRAAADHKMLIWRPAGKRVGSIPGGATMKILCIAALLACASFGRAEAQTPVTLFGTSTPHTAIQPDTNSVTLGVQFRSTQAGHINGVRFYRAARSSSGYTAAIFDGSSRARLAIKSVTAEPCTSMPCWEELDFSAPLSIAANKTYIATYFVKGGNYADDQNGLANQVTSGPLVAIANGQAAGGNGVYHYGTSLAVPDSTYQASNYFVDVAFITSAPPPRTLSISANPAAPSLDSASPPGTVVSTLTASWSDGSPFAGSYGFAQPYSNDGGLFTIQGNTVVTAASVSGDANTVQNITVEATQ
jgi:hypothetical protein